MFSGVPFVRFVLWLITGILIAYLNHFSVSIPMKWIIFVVILYGCTFIFHPRTFLLLETLRGIIGSIFLVVTGINLSYQYYALNDSQHFGNVSHGIAYKAVAISDSETQSNRSKIVVEVQAVRTDSFWKTCQGKAILYFQSPEKFYYGDVFLILEQTKRIPAPGNPFQFDYQGYMMYQNIFHQFHIKQGKILKIDHRPPSIWMSISLQIRRYADSVLQTSIPSSEAHSILTALLLGIKSSLHDDIRQIYASTGAMHVLAVSGLHVGLLYGIIQFLLSWTDRFKRGIVLKTFFSIFLLWSYAFVTGLSPSVLRAVTMFSLMAIAQATRRQTNIYNTIAVSAFLLLCFQPFLLFQVGFQLSYLAVVGIVYFQPKFYELLEFDNRLLDYIWQISCVALAATLATAPISIHYFGQFPTFFFVSNLIVVPLAALLLIGGLSIVVTSFLPFVPETLGYAINQIILGQNFLLEHLSNLPYAVITPVYLSTLETVGIYLFLVGISLHWFHHQRMGIKLACLAAVGYASYNIISKIMRYQEHQLWVYDLRQGTHVSFFSSENAYNYADTRLLAHHKIVQQVMKQHQQSTERKSLFFNLDSNFISPIPYVRLQEGHLWVYQNKTIFLLESGYENVPFSIDILITNHRFKISNVSSALSVRYWIADASVSQKSFSRLKQHIYSRKLFNIQQQGSVYLNLD
ncbi:MAG: competence protein ComEC family protein [Cytophagales bacterium]|nr:competence protein ComEC family protein [Cytophagales bacterium]MDW8384576.1 ComEC/Rec2 family competence protein [Flammeovirgaceae bacterium]